MDMPSSTHSAAAYHNRTRSKSPSREHSTDDSSSAASSYSHANRHSKSTEHLTTNYEYETAAAAGAVRDDYKERRAFFGGASAVQRSSNRHLHEQHEQVAGAWRAKYQPPELIQVADKAMMVSTDDLILNDYYTRCILAEQNAAAQHHSRHSSSSNKLIKEHRLDQNLDFEVAYDYTIDGVPVPNRRETRPSVERIVPIEHIKPSVHVNVNSSNDINHNNTSNTNNYNSANAASSSSLYNQHINQQHSERHESGSSIGGHEETVVSNVAQILSEATQHDLDISSSSSAANNFNQLTRPSSTNTGHSNLGNIIFEVREKDAADAVSRNSNNFIKPQQSSNSFTSSLANNINSSSSSNHQYQNLQQQSSSASLRNIYVEKMESKSSRHEEMSSSSSTKIESNSSSTTGVVGGRPLAGHIVSPATTTGNTAMPSLININRVPPAQQALAGEDANLKNIIAEVLESDARASRNNGPILSSNAETHAELVSRLGEIVGENKLFGMVKLTVHYDELRTRLSVTVHEARSLRNLDKKTVSDPYARVYLLPDDKPTYKRRTKIIKNNLNPVWQETFDYPMKLETAVSKHLIVNLKDERGIFERQNSVFLGEVVINLKNVPFLTTPNTKWYYLQPSKLIKADKL